MIALILPLLMILGPGPTDVGASLIALLFLVHVVVDRDRGALQAWWFRLALVLWVFMLATAPFALASVSEAFGRAATFLRFPMLAAALGFWLLTEPKWRDRYMVALTAVLLFSAAWALVECYWMTRVIQSYEHPLRLTGPFDDRKVGIFLTKTLFPCLGFALAWAVAGSLRRLLPVGAGLLLVLLAIFLSGERSAFLLAGLGLLIMALMVPVPAIRRFMRYGLLVAVFGALASYLAFPASFDRQVGSTLGTLSRLSTTSYGLLWQSGIEVGELSPVVGAGGKNFRDVCPEIRSPNIKLQGTDYSEYLEFCSTHPHNAYVEMFAEHGIIGLVIFLALIGGFVAACLPQRMDPVAVGAGLGILLILWPAVPHGSFFNNWNGVVFWSLVGLMVSRVALPRPSRTG
ncbi:O-antigen ligase family protein [Tistrella mobilis]|uniref:O-antigen ligase family protein n=1 Tax=Tistrella mobilis TaxID=171437 RepID=UPI0035569E62